MKALKIIGKVLLWTVVVVIIILLALPLWIGPVATGVANSVVPGITGTDFNLGRFALSQYSGVLEVGDMTLSNPTNYDERTAVRLDNLKVDVGMTSLASDVIHIEEVTLNGLYIYSSSLLGGNFKDIAKNAAGDGKTEDEPKAEEPKTEEPKAEEPKSDKPAKKVVIDRLTLEGIRLKIGPAPAIPIMTITLTDLGKPKDPNAEAGISFEELWQTIFQKVMSAAGSVGDAVLSAGKIGADAIGKGLDVGKEGLNSAVDAIKNVNVDGAKDALKSAGEGLKGVGKNLGDLFK